MGERVRRAEAFDHRAMWQVRLMEYDPFPLEFGRVCYAHNAQGYPRRTEYREVRTPQVELWIEKNAR